MDVSQTHCGNNFTIYKACPESIQPNSMKNKRLLLKKIQDTRYTGHGTAMPQSPSK